MGIDDDIHGRDEYDDRVLIGLTFADIEEFFRLDATIARRAMVARAVSETPGRAAAVCRRSETATMTSVRDQSGDGPRCFGSARPCRSTGLLGQISFF
jgi:hypothetical protein